MSESLSRPAAEEMLHVLQTKTACDRANTPAGASPRRMPRLVDYHPPFGRRWSFPAALAEMAPDASWPLALAQPVYIGGLNPFVSFCIAPPAMALGRRTPPALSRALASGLRWGMNHFRRPPFGAVITLSMTGKDAAGRAVKYEQTLRHFDSYFFAAASFMAFFKPYAGASPAPAGLRIMGRWVDPAAHMENMKALGVEAEESLEETARTGP